MNVVLIILVCVALIWLVPVYLSFFLPSFRGLHSLKHLGSILVVVGILNFMSFFVISMFIGGDAVGNPPVDGRYNVSEHGHRTEVSRRVYEYSLIHARSVWVTHPLAFVGAMMFYDENETRKRKPNG